MTETDDAGVTDAGGLSRSEVRDRTFAGVFFVTASGFVNLVIAFVGNLILAQRRPLTTLVLLPSG